MVIKRSVLRVWKMVGGFYSLILISGQTINIVELLLVGVVVIFVGYSPQIGQVQVVVWTSKGLREVPYQIIADWSEVKEWKSFSNQQEEEECNRDRHRVVNCGITNAISCIKVHLWGLHRCHFVITTLNKLAISGVIAYTWAPYRVHM